MGVLQVHDVTLAFGDRYILKNISFNLDGTTRAALTGMNGSGKSTLLKVITGNLTADSFEYTKSKSMRVSYLPQSDILFGDESVYDAAEEGMVRFYPLLEEKKQIENQLVNISQGDSYTHLTSRLSQIDEELNDGGYHNRERTIKTILSGLGFKESDFSKACKTFSGGWQMRVALARILIENPDLLLLDEPTNYLDIEATTWLKNYLQGFNGGIMLVSHDQDFLDETVNTVYELFNGKLTKYAGNYSKYLVTREEEIKALKKAYEKQVEDIEKTQQFIEKFRYKATKAKQVQSRIKALEKIEMVEIPENFKKIKFSFPPAPHSGNDVLKIENLYKSYKDNVIFENFSFMVKKGERLAITGRNGAGKSTLLRLLSNVDKDYKGSIIDGSGIKKGYFAQDNETALDNAHTVLEEVESVAGTKDIPSLRSLLGAFLFNNDDVFKKIEILSGGEKSRLSLLKILLHPHNLLLLDEPTNHLDINSKNMLLQALKDYNGTLIFVSHDKFFIKNLATRILYLTEEGPEFFEGDYDYFTYKIEQKEAQFSIRLNSASNHNVETNSDYKSSKARRNKLNALKREIDNLFEEIELQDEKLDKLEIEINKKENYMDSEKISSLLKEKEMILREKEAKEILWLEKSELMSEETRTLD